MRKARYFLVLIAFILALKSFAQTPAKELFDSYKNKSTTELRQFFEQWHNTIQPVSKDELSKMSDTIQQAYSIFTIFYKPTDIAARGGSEFGNDIYKNASYLLVQNSLSIYIRGEIFDRAEIDSIVTDDINKSDLPDSSKRLWLKRSNGKLSNYTIGEFETPELIKADKDQLICKVNNFRPTINCGDKRQVYLTGKYDTILKVYLGNKYVPLGKKNTMNPAYSAGASAERQKFLENFIKIWYGHWGGYWQLLSYPAADRIIFDKSMKRAIVDFTMVYEGGEALLEKQDGEWKLISAKRTWIE